MRITGHLMQASFCQLPMTAANRIWREIAVGPFPPRAVLSAASPGYRKKQMWKNDNVPTSACLFVNLKQQQQRQSAQPEKRSGIELRMSEAKASDLPPGHSHKFLGCADKVRNSLKQSQVRKEMEMVKGRHSKLRILSTKKTSRKSLTLKKEKAKNKRSLRRFWTGKSN